MGARDELPIPPEAIGDAGSAEVLRVWIANRGMYVSLQKAFPEAEVWGMLLVDIARHASRVFAAETAMSEHEALERIRKQFDKEWSRPTDLGLTEPHKRQ